MTDDLARWADNGGPAIDTPTGYVKHLLAEIGRLQERLGEALVRENNLRVALKFYAEDGDWNSSEMDNDCGETARKALAGE